MKRSTVSIHSDRKTLADWLPENNRLERIWKLAEVDFRQRYYNDRLGVIWALLNPGFQILIYYFVFKYLLKSSQPNFAMFLFSGILIWQTFREASSKGLLLLEAKRYVIENIQFNKIDLFVSATLSVLFGFTYHLIIYVLVSVLVGIPILKGLVLLPYTYVVLFFMSTGISMILATIKIYLKDIVHLWSMVLLAGFWTSGVFFDAFDYLRDTPFEFIIYVNPIILLLDIFRSGFLDNQWPNLYHMVALLLYSICLFVIGKMMLQKNIHNAIENM